MNGSSADAQTKALEFVNQGSSYALFATIALLAWVASGVEFTNRGCALGFDGVPDAVGCCSASDAGARSAGAGSAAAGPVKL